MILLLVLLLLLGGVTAIVYRKMRRAQRKDAPAPSVVLVTPEPVQLNAAGTQYREGSRKIHM